MIPGMEEDVTQTGGKIPTAVAPLAQVLTNCTEIRSLTEHWDLLLVRIGLDCSFTKENVPGHFRNVDLVLILTFLGKLDFDTSGKKIAFLF